MREKNKGEEKDIFFKERGERKKSSLDEKESRIN